MGRFAAIVLFVLGMPLAAVLSQQVRDLAPTLVLISFDGWRWDYEMKAPAPNLRALAARGVKAERLIPSFPTKTFPNHYTIVTGLYPGHHGIVGNSIRDAASGRTFTLSNRAEVGDPMWWGGEPIWVTLQRAGQRAAAMFWPGSEAPIAGMFPRYWREYDEDLPGSERVDQALRWLDLPKAERPTLITLYFEDTDTAGHEHGPDSQEVRDAIVRDDGYLGRLVDGLEQRGLRDRVNVVVVSDHGMTAVSQDRVVVLDDYVTLDASEVVDLSPLIALFPKAGTVDAVYRALEGAPRMTVYRREETPERWHLRDHPRTAPIVGVMDEGWQLLRRGTVEAMRAGRVQPAGGDHGYDTGVASMHGLFAAAGPAFKQGVRVPAFENVHVYDVLADVLGVEPAANDGDQRVARSLLK